MLRRSWWVLALAFFSFVSAPAAVRAEDEPELTFEQAFMIAQRQVPDGTLIRARVEGASVFGFYFWQRPRVVEIEIQRNGNLRKRVKSDEGDEVSKDVLDMMQQLTRGKTKLPDGRILEIARKKLKDTPLKEVKYVNDNGKLVVDAGNGVRIDPVTGQSVPPAAGTGR